MFTGIINGLGNIVSIVSARTDRRFEIKPLFPMPDIIDGESIAVNGACLSVEQHQEGIFTVFASQETINRTTLGNLSIGSKVNLERAIKAGERLGGHLVSGHIDCVARVTRRKQIGGSIQFRLAYPASFSPQVVEKGSVALDGISLTVNACGKDWLEVNIIPDSQRKTNIPSWKIGDFINMETDIIGKYVEHILSVRNTECASKTIDQTILASYGFL